MGDMGDYWRDVKPFLKEQSKKKRASNQENSTAILRALSLKFEQKNNGVHLIVKHNEKTVDFWPSTGRFICRSGKKGDYGIFNLLKHLGIPRHLIKLAQEEN
jgi:hypothetical protein